MRNFLQKAMYKFSNFMYGRNGIDKLNIFIMIVYLLTYCIFSFIRLRILYFISLIFPIIFLFRFLSKNIYKRQKENEVYMKYYNRAEPSLTLMKNKIRFLGKKSFRKCPQCKTVLKLPWKRGKHNVICPNCGKNFKVFIP